MWPVEVQEAIMKVKEEMYICIIYYYCNYLGLFGIIYRDGSRRVFKVERRKMIWDWEWVWEWELGLGLGLE